MQNLNYRSGLPPGVSLPAGIRFYYRDGDSPASFVPVEVYPKMKLGPLRFPLPGGPSPSFMTDGWGFIELGKIGLPPQGSTGWNVSVTSEITGQSIIVPAKEAYHILP